MSRLLDFRYHLEHCFHLVCLAEGGGGDNGISVYSFIMFSAISFVNEHADTIIHVHVLFQVFFPDVERVEWLNKVSQ